MDSSQLAEVDTEKIRHCLIIESNEISNNRTADRNCK